MGLKSILVTTTYQKTPRVYIIHKMIQRPGDGCGNPLSASSTIQVVFAIFGGSLCQTVDAFWLQWWSTVNIRKKISSPIICITVHHCPLLSFAAKKLLLQKKYSVSIDCMFSIRECTVQFQLRNRKKRTTVLEKRDVTNIPGRLETNSVTCPNVDIDNNIMCHQLVLPSIIDLLWTYSEAKTNKRRYIRSGVQFKLVIAYITKSVLDRWISQWSNQLSCLHWILMKRLQRNPYEPKQTGVQIVCVIELYDTDLWLMGTVYRAELTLHQINKLHSTLVRVS